MRSSAGAIAETGLRPRELVPDPDQHELRRLQRGEADEDVDDGGVDVGLRRRLRVALDEVRAIRRGALKSAPTEQVAHERIDLEPDPRPKRLVVRLEYRPVRATV